MPAVVTKVKDACCGRYGIFVSKDPTLRAVYFSYMTYAPRCRKKKKSTDTRSTVPWCRHTPNNEACCGTGGFVLSETVFPLEVLYLTKKNDFEGKSKAQPDERFRDLGTYAE